MGKRILTINDEISDGLPDINNLLLVFPDVDCDVEDTEVYTISDVIDLFNEHLNITIEPGQVDVNDLGDDVLDLIYNQGGRNRDTTSGATPSRDTSGDPGIPEQEGDSNPNVIAVRGNIPKPPIGIPITVDPIPPDDSEEDPTQVVVDPVDDEGAPDPVIIEDFEAYVVEDPDPGIPVVLTIDPSPLIRPPTQVSVPVVNLPGQPTNLFITERDGALLVNYEPPKNDGGADVTYQVAITQDTGSVSIADLAWIDKEDEQSHLFSDLTNGVSYLVFVRCRNTAGFSFVSQKRATPVVPRSRSNITLTVETDNTYYTEVGGGFTVITYALRYSDSISGNLDTSEITFNNCSLYSTSKFLNFFYVVVLPDSYTNPVSINVGEDAASTATGAKISAAVTSPEVPFRADLADLQPPSNIQVIAGNGEATINWELPVISEELDGFQIRIDNGDYVNIPIDVLTHRFIGLTNDQEYTVYLRSTTPERESSPVEIKVTPSVDLDVVDVPAEALPSAPRNPAYYQLEDGSIELRWEAPLRSNFNGFQVRVNDNDWDDLNAGIRSYVYSTDDRWDLIRFYLRSTNDRGFSNTLELSLVAVGNPDPITGVAAEAGNGIVKVTWDELSAAGIPGEHDLGQSRIQYPVLRYKKATDTDFPYEWGTVGHAGNTEWYLQLENEVEYTIEMTSRTEQFQSDVVRSVNVTPSATYAANNTPSAPQNLTLTAGSGQLTANWDAPSDDGGNGGIVFYELWIRPIDTNSEYVSWVQVDGTTTTFTFSNLDPGQSHTVTLRAINNNGTFGQLLEHPPVESRLVSDSVEASGTPT